MSRIENSVSLARVRRLTKEVQNAEDFASTRSKAKRLYLTLNVCVQKRRALGKSLIVLVILITCLSSQVVKRVALRVDFLHAPQNTESHTRQELNAQNCTELAQVHILFEISVLDFRCKSKIRKN